MFSSSQPYGRIGLHFTGSQFGVPGWPYVGDPYFLSILFVLRCGTYSVSFTLEELKAKRAQLEQRRKAIMTASQGKAATKQI